MKALTVFVSAFALCVSASAQLAEAPAEIKALDWMLGTWEGTGTFTMMGQSGEISMAMTVKMDGPFIKIETKQSTMGIDMTETGYIHWDPKKKEYLMTTYTNFATTPRVEHGTFAGGVFKTLCEPWEVMGMETVGRTNLKQLSKDEVEFMLEMKEGDKWAEASKIKMKKKYEW